MSQNSTLITSHNFFLDVNFRNFYQVRVIHNANTIKTNLHLVHNSRWLPPLGIFLSGLSISLVLSATDAKLKSWFLYTIIERVVDASCITSLFSIFQGMWLSSDQGRVTTWPSGMAAQIALQKRRFQFSTRNHNLASSTQCVSDVWDTHGPSVSTEII